MKAKNLPRQVRLAVLRQQDEQQELLPEAHWEMRQRSNEERWAAALAAEEEYWAAMELQELLEGEEDW